MRRLRALRKMASPLFKLNLDPSNRTDPGVLFSGTSQELVHALSKVDPDMAAAPMPPDGLCNFIESNAALLRENGVDAQVDRSGTQVRITLRALSHRSHDTGSVTQHQEPEPPPQASYVPETRDNAPAPVLTSAGADSERPTLVPNSQDLTSSSPAPSNSARHQEPLENRSSLPPSTANTEGSRGAQIPWLSESAEPRQVRAIRRESPLAIASMQPVTFGSLYTADSEMEASGPSGRKHWVVGVIAVLMLLVVGLVTWVVVDRLNLGGRTESLALIDSLAAGQPTDNTKRGVRARSNSQRETPQGPVDIGSLFREASGQRISGAQYQLGRAYAEGRAVKRDKVSAYVWLVLARSNGDPDAESLLSTLAPELSVSDRRTIRLALANMYSRGVGVEPDLIAAYIWLNLAEAAGASEAAERKQELEPKLSGGQIAWANTRSLELLRAN